MALTDVEIRALKARYRIYKCTDSHGLYLEVHPSGSKLWRCKYTHLGKDKRIALGR
ncbi:MAG: Arm DNA-binding domain-containing protein [Sphingomonas sp.]